jgi:outer membrane receptor for ferrienterochelin and colicin
VLTDQALDFYERLRDNPPFKEDFPQIQRPDNSGTDDYNTSIMFYDTYAKLTLIPGKKDVINFSGYLSGDEISDEFVQLNPTDSRNLEWGNYGYSIRWHRSWNEALYSNVLISSSRYDVNETPPGDSALFRSTHYFQSDINNSVEEFNIKMDNQWRLVWSHDFHTGFHFSKFTTDFNESVAEHDDILVHGATGETFSFYLQDKWQIHSRARLMAGIRATHFVTTLNSDAQIFWNPRFSADYNIFGNWSLKAAWGQYRQYILNFGNQFANFEGRLTWMIADNVFLKPSQSRHNVIGVKWENTQVLFDLEFYRKDLIGQVEQVNSIEVEDGVPQIKTSLVQRDGTYDGLDLLLAKKRGKFSGWLSYSYNNTELTLQENALAYPGPADVPHNLNIVGNYRFRSFTFSAVWSYSNGNPYSVPDTYESEDLNGAIHFLTAPVERYTERLPDRQRLDVSAFYQLKTRSVQARLGISLYNVLDRNNVWYRHFSLQEGELSKTDVLMPGITPTFVFELAFR